jgi:hypothetical protein
MSSVSTVSNRLSDDALDQLFREARTHSKWLDKPVTDETLRHLYDLTKWGHQRQRFPRAFLISAFAAGQAAAPAVSFTG